jgi:hypothetical protein
MGQQYYIEVIKEVESGVMVGMRLLSMNGVGIL